MGQPVSFSDVGEVRKNHSADKLVYTNGCFDLLHPGHLAWLDTCKKIGDILIVGVTPDEVVARRKGAARPIQPDTDRLTIITALGVVDYGFVTPAQSDRYPFTGMGVMDVLRPDVFVTYDPNWQKDEGWLASIGVELEFIEPVRTVAHSTTGLIERARACSSE